MEKIIPFLQKWMPRKLYDWCCLLWYIFQIPLAYHAVLKKRVNRTQKNEKMRIVFIVQRTEVFNSVRSIVEAAAASDACEVYLLPLPRCSRNPLAPDLSTYPSVVEFCQQLNLGTVLDTYDSETGTCYDLTRIMPDYIFLNVPYTDEYPELYEMRNLVKIAKVCYVPYGYAVPNEKRFHQLYSSCFFLSLLENVDFLFADGAAVFAHCHKKMCLSELLNGKRLYQIGYPRFDLISIRPVQPEAKNVLWLPRWTSAENPDNWNLASHFLKYKDLLPEYMKARQDGHLVVRPHPLMFPHYIEEGIMTTQEVQEYRDRLECSQWVSLDENPSYEDAFTQADVLVADYSSIIIEFAYLGKPVIYCGSQWELSPRISYLTDTFYYAEDWEQLKKVLDDLKDGIDPLKEKRTAAVEKFRKSTQDAAQNILEVLQKDFERSGRKS